mmetsp:Transcript_125807/g.246580  ORF Transcript_125807/g.246580 Transcript_125807/m.246580 type:complete len:233 (+) Transcript_125807:73-771(+)
MTAEAKFNQDGYHHRTVLYDSLMEAKANPRYKGNLNFSAHRQGTDEQYLGVNGKNYYAKPWGNDSSNVQSILNGPAYWKRVYYRENIAARFQREDAMAARARAAEEATRSGGLRKSQSEGAMQRSPPAPEKEPEDPYAHIKETMKPLVERQGKPKIRKMEHGERLHFFNTLDNKYHIKAGGKNLTWNVSKQTHRSTPTEMRWILSNYFRTDTPAILDGYGHQPALSHSASQP